MNTEGNLPNQQRGDGEVSNEQHVVDEVASPEHLNLREPLEPLREITSNDCSTPCANADADRQARINKTKRWLTEKWGWKFNVPPPPAAEDGPDGPADHMNGMAANRDSEESERATNASDPQKGVPCPQDSGSENVGHKIVIDTVADFLRRFVFLQDETYYRLIAAWIVATHLHKKFEYLGYLFVYSPERRSGKTTLLGILNMLVYESTGLQISPTEAVMFRTAEGHTHLLDEVDSWKNKSDLKDVLNAGYRKGGTVIRYDRGKAGSQPTAFSVFAPRAMAGIGLSILHSTTLDRTFAVPMVRQKKGEKRERSRERVIGRQAKALKQEIEHWVKDHEKMVAENL